MAHYRIKTLELDPYTVDITESTVANALREYTGDQHIKILDAKCIHAEDDKVIHYYKIEDSEGIIYTQTVTETATADDLKGKKRR